MHLLDFGYFTGLSVISLDFGYFAGFRLALSLVVETELFCIEMF